MEQVNAKFAPCYALGEAKRSITEGLELMKTFMSRDPETDIDDYGTPAENIPAYFVDPKCTNTIREHNNYKAPESTKGLNVPEAGLKQEDHTIDAIRYGLMHVFKLGAIYSLADVAEINDNVPKNVGLTEPGMIAVVNGGLDTQYEHELLTAGLFTDTGLGNGEHGYFSSFESMEF